MHNTFPADDWASKFRLFDAIPTWSRRLMEDRVRVAGDRAARLAALREHRDRMKKLEEMYTELRQGESWKLWSIDMLNVKYHRLEADQLLAEAGVDAGEATGPAKPEPKPAAAPGADDDPRSIDRQWEGSENGWVVRATCVSPNSGRGTTVATQPDRRAIRLRELGRAPGGPSHYEMRHPRLRRKKRRSGGQGVTFA